MGVQGGAQMAGVLFSEDCNVSWSLEASAFRQDSLHRRASRYSWLAVTSTSIQVCCWRVPAFAVAAGTGLQWLQPWPAFMGLAMAVNGLVQGGVCDLLLLLLLWRPAALLSCQGGVGGGTLLRLPCAAPFTLAPLCDECLDAAVCIVSLSR